MTKSNKTKKETKINCACSQGLIQETIDSYFKYYDTIWIVRIISLFIGALIAMKWF